MAVEGFFGKGDRAMHATSDKNGVLKKRNRVSLPFFMDDAFWRGVANVFSVSGYFFAASRPFKDPTKADYEALKKDWEALSGDWIMVGRDMHRAVRRFESEHTDELRVARQERLFNPDDEPKP